jgi:hypothetical protein
MTCVTQGLITDKELLPVIGLHFGRTALPRTLMQFTLGRFECKGQHQQQRERKRLTKNDDDDNNSDEMPSNCDELRSLGHRFAGFYSVKDSNQQNSIKIIYCQAASYETDVTG